MANSTTTFPWPIAVLSFGRPSLLESVLTSLRLQTQRVDNSQIFLFQDGAVDQWTDQDVIPPATKEACIAIFRSAFPGGNVVSSDTNLGIALNYDRAERAMLQRAEAAAFFEDDLILTEHYLDALGKMLTFALGEERVGYVGAYGDHRATIEQQTAGRRRVVSLGHKWGFGLTQRQWQRQLPLIEPYIKLLDGTNYRLRDHNKIFGYFAKLGYTSTASSQDAAKDIAALVLGTTNLMTYACYGKYLGEIGVHQTPALYKQAGYSDTALFPDAPVGFDFPSGGTLDLMISNHRTIAQNTHSLPTKAPARSSLSRFGTPHLFQGEQEVFEREISTGCKSYLEFGLGGSTLIAIRRNLKVVAIDSDPDWTEQATKHPEISLAVSKGTAIIRHADIGPISVWGNPKDRSAINKWPNYVNSAWDSYSSGSQPFPDVVFVDGRFRVACCLSIILASGFDRRLTQKIRVLLHDVGAERPHYDPVFQFFSVVDSINTLRIMKIKEDVSAPAVMAIFLRSLLDQR